MIVQSSLKTDAVLATGARYHAASYKVVEQFWGYHQMLTPFQRLAILGLASMLAVPQVSAGDLPPEPVPGTSVIGYLHHERSGLLAMEAARRLDRNDPAFSPELHQLLLAPMRAEALVSFPPLPDHLHIVENSPRWFLQRHLVLEYPIVVDAEAVVAALRRTQLFGYVDQVREGGYSPVPNDPYYPTNSQSAGHIPSAYRSQSWFFSQMNFPAAWDITTGHAIVGMMDSGIDSTHPDLVGALRPGLSWAFGFGLGTGAVHEDLFGGHGTHTSGLLAARSNNSQGTAGACWNCGIAMAKLQKGDDVTFVRSLTHLVQNGVQLANHSGFILVGSSDPNCPPPDLRESLPQEYLDWMASAHPFCAALDLAWHRHSIYVASSGNNKGPVNFPARTPVAILVGGTESTGIAWDSADDEGCPAFPPPPPPLGTECGTNFGPEQDFVAPAKHVLSTFVPDGTWNEFLICNDESSLGAFVPSGYDYCTGTSMSAPLVTGAMALLRSAHPNLSPTLTALALQQTASGGGTHNNQYGYGIPHVGNALKRVLGTSNSVQLQNRLTPMFVLYHADTTSYLYTSKPQVAAAAITNTLYIDPPDAQFAPPAPSFAYTSDATLGPSIRHYFEYPIEVRSDNLQLTLPRVAFWLFSTDKNPFDATPLRPLHRLALDLTTNSSCTAVRRDHGYAVDQAGIDYFSALSFCAQPYALQGIEGYLLPACPAGFTCLPQNRLQEGGLQCLYLRRRSGSSNQEDWALILEDHLPGNPGSPYPSHTLSAPGMSGCLGYVFTEMHSDGDVLIDGVELLLGTNRLSTNSDSDCLADSQEYPPFGLPNSDPRIYTPPGSGSCDVIFANSFQ